jgi:cytoskeletal protein CcmA (bactofilin family)
MVVQLASTQELRSKESRAMEQTQPSWTPLIPGRRESPPGSTPEEIPCETPAPPPAAVLEHGCALEGRLVTDKPIRIEGELRGSLVSSETVWVTESGTVEGDIQARSVEIRGAVVGNVSGSRDVLLCPTGKLHGDVETSSLVVERGAYFNGRTTMRQPQHASRKTLSSYSGDT